MSTLSVATIKSQSTTASTAFQNSNGVVLGVLCVGFGTMDLTGTLELNNSMRVSDTGTGELQVNLSTAFPDTLYVVVTGSGFDSTTSNATTATDVRGKTTSSFQLQMEDVDSGFIDTDYSMFALFDT